jgi:hypothetical protein
MTIRKTFIAAILCLLTTLSAAQDTREQIELVLMDGNTAIFSSEGFSNDKQVAVDNSCKAVLNRILYNGVEGFNGGEAIVTSGQQTNIWLKNFFTGKYPAYKSFVGGVELLGGFDNTPQGEIHCRTHVIIDFGKLMSTCRTQGLMEEAGARPIEQRTTAPQQMKQRPKRSF